MSESEREAGVGYVVVDDVAVEPTDTPEPTTRYFAAIRRKPWGGKFAGDPIPWLVTIYRGEAVESYWRGTEQEAQDALAEYLGQRVSSDD